MPSPAPLFAAKTDYVFNSRPKGIAIGDFNSDGKMDFAVTDASNLVSILLNKGDGTFAPKVDYAVGSGSMYITAGDVNSDGKMDLITSNNFSMNASVLINKGDGTFAPKVDYATSPSGVNGFPYGLTNADLNGDGKTDLIIANNGVGKITVLLNKGDGTYPTAVDYAAGLGPWFVDSADLNGDGKGDLVAANFHSGNLSVYLNNGDGTFANKVDYSAGGGTYTVACADVNGDGKADLIASSYRSGSISVLINDGKGEFPTGAGYVVGAKPVSVTTADVNGDNKLDIIVTNEGSNSVSVLTNNGDGTFAPIVNFATGASPYSVVAADFNGDGRPDLVVANPDGPSVSVLMNAGTWDAKIPKTLFSTTASDLLTGGAGTDTAVFSNARAAYTITKTATGWTVSSATDGTDTLTSIERLKFSDKTIALDTSGNAGQVYRVYQAAFDRKPDLGGLGDWIYGMDKGMSLTDLASGFIASPEFKSFYGQNPTTAELVNRLYQNVLHRAAEKAGFDYWVNQLDSGLQSKSQVLAGFSESPENQVQVIGVIQNGIDYTPHVI